MMSKNNHDFSPIEFYETKVRPKLNLETVLYQLNPRRSGNRLTLDCPSCKKHEAFIYDNNDFINCNRRNNCSYSKSFIGYLEETNGKSWWEIVTQLAKEAEVAIPDREYSPAESLRIEERNKKQSILNDFHNILVEELHSENGKKAREYLEGRGFSAKFIRANEFGFFGNPEWINTQLLDRGYSQHDINTSGIFYDKRWTGRIVYPIRDRKKICDFWAHDITEKAPKELRYLRMNKDFAPDNAAMFGLDTAIKDIVLVEGHFDQLMLSAYGIPNVVSLGGAKLWNQHQKKLAEHKVRSITLVLDDDKGGNEGIDTIINLLKNSDLEVFVIPPSLLGGLDPDDYVIKNGANTFDELLIDKAIHSFEFKAKTLLEKHKDSGDWNKLKQYKLLDEAGIFYASVTNPKRALACDAFWETIMHEANISDTTIDQYRKDAQEKRAREKQKKLLEATRVKIKTLAEVDDLDGITAEINAYKEQNRSQDNKFSFLLEKDSEEKLIEEFKKEVPSIETGYKIGEVALAFPAGALSFIAGATGHGKTTVLINISLGVNKNNPGANIYFFTYEEIRSRIVAKFLNTFFGKPLNSGNNKGAIQHYFSAEDHDRLKFFNQNREEFEEKKKEFFSKLIDNGRLQIRQLDMPVEELVDAITFIKKNDPNASLIVIDYVQRLTLNSKSNSARHEELKEICKLLEGCAIKTGLPIVLGAQFNREVKTEADLNQYSIAEGHDIARTAELMIGIWNRSHNSPDTREDEMHIKILKGRNVGFGHEAIMSFDGNTGVIKNQPSNLNIKPAIATPNKNKAYPQKQKSHFDKLAEL